MHQFECIGDGTVAYEYDKAMGAQVRALRAAKGMTQEELAAQLQTAGCDITRSAVAKIEAGQRHIYAQEIKAIQQVLGVAYEQLFV